jgi:hypothetical protein
MRRTEKRFLKFMFGGIAFVVLGYLNLLPSENFLRVQKHFTEPMVVWWDFARLTRMGLAYAYYTTPYLCFIAGLVLFYASIGMIWKDTWDFCSQKRSSKKPNEEILRRVYWNQR